ncbi:MAG: hypothetical protein A2Y24_00555 [Clostridiales bacterium GWE2_32_10]|nr:MAG: hypothetical protein A2Y24_00555 [Clostridiales bacterium GWE2_32_10]HBY19716.1 hypothetical protein [Clostridiales bacterium]
MSLQLVRENLNMLDDTIKKLIVLRMSIIPIVAEIKLRDNLPIFQPEREEQMFDEMEKFCEDNGIDREVVRKVYEAIIENARKIQYDMEKDIPPYNLKIEISENKEQELDNAFKTLEEIIKNDIANVFKKFNNIVEDDETNAKNIVELATYYYKNKILK